ncbi:NUDIX hydrolase [Schaalia sp. ZJ1691]|uniref:NUDIX domain-containing protein n=1 Tax=Schaalia sp. ZJ1691 TaxID=2709404 RepID=UPI0013EA02A2|nr:NUDIX hydrolase [Schaalia sp. ZJ1691]
MNAHNNGNAPETTCDTGEREHTNIRGADAGLVAEPGELSDRHVDREVLGSAEIWRGRVMGLAEDEVRVVDGQDPVTRQYVVHPGAVAIVALRGDEGEEQILLEKQYRHPVRSELLEIPAGLLDIAGEDPLVAAQRELAEEVDLQAQRWDVLVDYFTSPGGSNESIRIFLARDLVPTGVTFEREDEEAGMTATWVSLDEAVNLVFSGRIHNPNSVSGILAAFACRAQGWRTLRTTDAPWFR